MKHVSTKVTTSQEKHRDLTMGMEKTARRMCPRCRNAELHRSQMRGLIERGILRAVGFRAYRCGSCDERFIRFAGTTKPVSSGPANEKAK